MKRTRLGLFFVLAVSLSSLGTVISVAGDESILLGKKPGQVKGRWLKIYDGEAFKQYKEVTIGEIATEIAWKKEGKDTPVDEALLKDKIRERLLLELRESGRFEKVWEAAPEKERPGVLRLDCDLLVEPGNRATRYLVGFGAGKSKSILEVKLTDFVSQKEIGLYHGYGTGSGMGFKLGGGGARKMTQDDIQENAKMMADLLTQVP
jgi:hypothetical protein